MKKETEKHEAYLRQAAEEVDRRASQGLVVAVDPEVADYMGIFEEDALSADDALESIHDVDENDIVITADDDEEREEDHE